MLRATNISFASPVVSFVSFTVFTKRIKNKTKKIKFKVIVNYLGLRG